LSSVIEKNPLVLKNNLNTYTMAKKAKKKAAKKVAKKAKKKAPAKKAKKPVRWDGDNWDPTKG
jgi:hypothetical protein